MTEREAEEQGKRPDANMNVIIITGLSGAGKTNAVDWFEDQGYYCVDNMPPALIKDFISLSFSSEKHIEKAAFVVDVRGGVFFKDLKKCIVDLRNNDDIACKVLFIEASETTLVKRYNETRRTHPLVNGSVTKEVIIQEKERLREIRNMSEYIIDTTNMKVSELKSEINRLFKGGVSTFSINLSSFGYKYGIPQEADMVVDVRFIPNPYYVKSLKKLTGNNKKVMNYVLNKPITQSFCQAFPPILEGLIPGYMSEGKYHINIAFGCTGGQHRSVAIANRMASQFKKGGYRVTLEHRDL
jgi:UPF0042 nucleotide-binding protein